MALAITLKAGERITINDAQVIVDSRVLIRVMNDSQIELPDRGKTIARPVRVPDLEVVP